MKGLCLSQWRRTVVIQSSRWEEVSGIYPGGGLCNIFGAKFLFCIVFRLGYYQNTLHSLNSYGITVGEVVQIRYERQQEVSCKYKMCHGQFTKSVFCLQENVSKRCTENLGAGEANGWSDTTLYCFAGEKTQTLNQSCVMFQYV